MIQNLSPLAPDQPCPFPSPSCTQDEESEGEADPLPQLEVVMCHSMVALEEQVKMFVPNPSAARVILATNMAESSVTLPDVSYVRVRVERKR